MRSRQFAFILMLAAPALAQAQIKMEPGPKSPADSLACIKLRPGFTVELMAAEPLVQSPIAFAWGADGKFWVVEMGDYPLGVDGKGKPGGRVKFLEKTKGDGPYDKATLFLDNLGYPTGVFPWGKGVIITCAPDIFYAVDTDGDGKADKKVVLFTGFVEGNQQHRVNGLVWGLDGWIYGANGDSGGKIKAVNTLSSMGPGYPKGTTKPPAQKEPVNISGRDFRFKPDTGEFEAVTGQSQFGRCRDDWGNWFGCNNSNPCFHFVLDDHYLRRNPHVVYPAPKVNVPEKPGAAPVYPISKPLPRFNDFHTLNHFTSACSIHIYRDDLFGPEFANNTFVCEPVHNLIHREILTPKGLTFTSKRAADEQTSEFLASTDNWFRPTMVQTGPDGALWVSDMYRYVIEHPQWIPKDWQKKLDLRAGQDKGRIYRVYPEDKKPRAIPRVDKLDGLELIALLEHPNGWVRDVAQKKLESRSKWSSKYDARITQISEKDPRPHIRIQAMYVRGGLKITTLEEEQEKHAEVRRNAVQISESFFTGKNTRPGTFPPSKGTLAKAERALLKVSEDSSPQVRMQLAYFLGQWPGENNGQALARLAVRDFQDPYVLAAIMSSVNDKNWKPMLEEMISQGKPIPASVLEPMMRMAKAYGGPAGMTALLTLVAETGEKQPLADRFAVVGSLLDALDQRKSSLALLWKESSVVQRTALDRISEIFDVARGRAVDPKAAMAERVTAMSLLGRGIHKQEEDLKTLAGLLSPQQADEVQIAAANSLARLNDKQVPELLLKSWKTYAPKLRGQVLDGLLSRPDGLTATLDALEQKKILPLEIDAARRQRLLDHKDKTVRVRAAKLLAGSNDPDRRKVVDSYRPALKLEGDVARGAKVFTKNCAACHQLGGVGQQVGPDLASVGDKSPEGLLVAILDPNAAVEPRYLGYTAVTKSGTTYAGLLETETSTSVTLVGIDGKKHTILRGDLDELFSSGKSAMPEGLEKDIGHQEMADLLAFVRKSLPAQKPKVLEGNRPELVKADGDGVFHLTAATCAIYGKTLVLEKQYANLGHWSSADDRAVWTIEVPKAGKYAVFVNYACAKDASGNSFVMQAGTEKLAGKVENTGSWDTYRSLRIGSISLQAGQQEIEVRALPPIQRALWDLRLIKLVAEKS